MLKRFYPTKWVGSVYTDIDFHKLYKDGFRGLIIDIDNTLVEHNADANEKAIELLKYLKDMGFKICLLSNNNEDRVSRFNKDIKVYTVFDAKKPLMTAYNKAMKLMGTNKNNTIFIGDQIFTDVLGANNAGIASILVKPISPKEEIQITIKRFFENIILFFYKRNLNKRKK